VSLENSFSREVEMLGSVHRLTCRVLLDNYVHNILL
jgi:hypothetical protein